MKRPLGTLGRQPDFLRFWAAEGISQIGTQISLLVLPLIAAITLDASAFEAGVLAAAGQAPALVFGLVAGAWLDQRRRRPVMISADLGRAVLLSLVPLAAYFDVLSIELLAIVAFAGGTLTIFSISDTSRMYLRWSASATSYEPTAPSRQPRREPRWWGQESPAGWSG